MEGGRPSDIVENDKPLSSRGQRVLAVLHKAWKIPSHSTNSYQRQVLTTPRTSSHRSFRASSIRLRGPPILDRIEEEEFTDHLNGTYLHQVSQKSVYVPEFSFSTVQNTSKPNGNGGLQFISEVTSNLPLQKVREIKSTQDLFGSSYGYDQDVMSREKVSKYIQENFSTEVLPKVSSTQVSLDIFAGDDDDEAPMDLSPPQSVPLGRTTLNNVRRVRNVPVSVPISKRTNNEREASIISKDVARDLNQGMRKTNSSSLQKHDDVSKEDSDDFLNVSLMECDYSQGSTKPYQKETSDQLVCHGRMKEDARKIESYFSKNSELKERDEGRRFQKMSARIFNIEARHRPESLVTSTVNTKTNNEKYHGYFVQGEDDRGSLQKLQSNVLNSDENVADRADNSRRKQTNPMKVNVDKKAEPSKSPHLETCKYTSNQADENDLSLIQETGSYCNLVVPRFDLSILSIDDLFDEPQDTQESLLTSFIKDKDHGNISGDKVGTINADLQAGSSEDLFFSQLPNSEGSLADFMKDADQGDISGKYVCITPDLQAKTFSSEDLFCSGLERKHAEDVSQDFMLNDTDQAHKSRNDEPEGKTHADIQAKTFWSENLYCRDIIEKENSEGSFVYVRKDRHQACRSGKDVSIPHTDFETRSSEDSFFSDTEMANLKSSLERFVKDGDHSQRSVMDVNTDFQTQPMEEHFKFFSKRVLENLECDFSDIIEHREKHNIIKEDVISNIKTSSSQINEIKEQVGEFSILSDITNDKEVAHKNTKKNGTGISDVNFETNFADHCCEYFVQSEKENTNSISMNLEQFSKNKILSNPSKSSRSPQVFLLHHNTFELQGDERFGFNTQRPSKAWLPPNRSSDANHNPASNRSRKHDLSKKTDDKPKKECVKTLIDAKCTSHNQIVSGTHESKNQSRKRLMPRETSHGKVDAHKKQKQDGIKTVKPFSKQTKIPFKITKTPLVVENSTMPQDKTSDDININQFKSAVEVTVGGHSKNQNTTEPQGSKHKDNKGGNKVIKKSVSPNTAISKSPIIKRKLIIPDMFLKDKTKTSTSYTDTRKITCAKKTKFKVPYKREEMQGTEDKNIAQGSNNLPTEKISILQIDDQTYPLIEKKISNCTLKEIGLTIVYREGFSQLNLPEDKSTSAGHYTATGIMLGITSTINTTYCYLDANMEGWKNAGLPKAFLSTLLTATCKKICYDAQAMAMFLVDAFGFDHKEVCAPMEMIDPLVGYWLLDPDHPPNRFLDALVIAGVNQTARRMEDKHSRVCQSLQLLSDLAASLQDKLEERHLCRLFTGVEMKLVPVLAVMELRGMRVNKKKLQEISGILEKRIVFLQETAYKAAGRTFQLNSTVQLRQVLYEDLKLDVKHSVVIKGTESLGAKSTSEPMLRLLEKLHPLPGIVLEHRHLQKLKSTYVDAMLQHIRGDSIFTTWEQTATATGRISSSNPNLQAVPKQLVSSSTAEHSKHGPQFGPLSLRAPYVPREGCSFLTADFQHIELRLFAYLSQDTALLHELQQPGDIFMLLANSWLGKSGHVIGPDDREKTKRIVYSIMYGAGPGKLSEFLEVSAKEANQIINSFVAMFPALRAYPRRLVSQCRQQGYLCSISGRRRMFPNISSPNLGTRAHTERQAINFVIQGSAADICKSAMLHTEQRLSARPEFDVRLLLQIHDELVWDVPDKYLLEATEIVREAMMASTSLYGLGIQLKIPLPVTIATGCHWGDMKQSLPVATGGT